MEFDKQLNNAVDQIGSDKSKTDQLMDILSKLETAKEYVDQLEGDLSDLSEELCALVSAEMKKLLPKIKVILERGGCTFSYYARSITIRPNIKDKTWEIQPGPNRNDRQLANLVHKKLDGTKLTEYTKLVRGIAEILVKKYSTLRGGKIEIPDDEEIPDQLIDKAIGSSDKPIAPAGRAIEKKGVSQSDGGAQYV